MKSYRTLVGVFFLCILFWIVMFFFISCAPAYDDNKELKYKTVKRTISGIAAIGACIEQGATVQVRPASTDGVTPEALIEGVVGENGNYEIVVKTEEISVESDAEKSIKKSSISDIGTGYIIRVWSESANSWVYSYAVNNNSDVTANVNPYTDRFVRCFYNQSRVSQGRIDSYFPTGIKEDETLMTSPSDELVNKVFNTMTNMLYSVYELENIQNALSDSWEIDKGLDGLIGAIGINKLGTFLENEFFNLINDPDVLTNGKATQDYLPSPVVVEIWTPYGNTGSVTMRYSDNTGSPMVTMIKQSDSVEGKNHFMGVSSNTGQCTSPYGGVYIQIADYNNGAGFEIAIRRP